LYPSGTQESGNSAMTSPLLAQVSTSLQPAPREPQPRYTPPMSVMGAHSSEAPQSISLSAPHPGGVVAAAALAVLAGAGALAAGVSDPGAGCCGALGQLGPSHGVFSASPGSCSMTWTWQAMSRTEQLTASVLLPIMALLLMAIAWTPTDAAVHCTPYLIPGADSEAALSDTPRAANRSAGPTYRCQPTALNGSLARSASWESASACFAHCASRPRLKNGIDPASAQCFA